jgi:hypothetical protein
MAQQGQVFKLDSKDADARALWAYRYRTGGRGSKRMQRGGFVSEVDARLALDDRARPVLPRIDEWLGTRRPI